MSQSQFQDGFCKVARQIPPDCYLKRDQGTHDPDDCQKTTQFCFELWRSEARSSASFSNVSDLVRAVLLRVYTFRLCVHRISGVSNVSAQSEAERILEKTIQTMNKHELEAEIVGKTNTNHKSLFLLVFTIFPALSMQFLFVFRVSAESNAENIGKTNKTNDFQTVPSGWRHGSR